MCSFEHAEEALQFGFDRRQWAKLAPLFIVQRTSKWPLRAVVNDIFFVLKNGCVWRDVPADFPPRPIVYYYFTKWTADGT